MQHACQPPSLTSTTYSGAHRPFAHLRRTQCQRCRCVRKPPRRWRRHSGHNIAVMYSISEPSCHGHVRRYTPRPAVGHSNNSSRTARSRPTCVLLKICSGWKCMDRWAGRWRHLLGLTSKGSSLCRCRSSRALAVCLLCSCVHKCSIRHLAQHHQSVVKLNPARLVARTTYQREMELALDSRGRTHRSCTETAPLASLVPSAQS